MLGSVHFPSIWFNSDALVETLREAGVRTLVVAGLSTDQHVSTAVRELYNLALVGRLGGEGNVWDVSTEDLWTDGEAVVGIRTDPGAKEGELANDMMRVILVSDATRALGRGRFDGQTVHDVHIESLRDYAEIRTTAEVLGAFE
jgi:hypothetical protein